MSESINFIANTKDFKSVKKMKVTDDIKDMDILEFLAALEVSTNTQIGKYFEKFIDLNSLESSLLNNFSKDLISFNKFLNSSEFLKVIEKSINQEYKSKIKELVDVCKSYSLNKYLLENNLVGENAIGYYRIIFPTRKKILKKVIK